jgi:hypothetical protein
VVRELEAAATGSLRHLVGGRTKPTPDPGATCRNCGAVLQGPFCHACGQDADTHKRSILRLIWEAFEALFELDGRLWRTLPALFLRPGALARDYLDGRIVRHVPPFRTFLVALVLFIFAAEHAAHELTQANARQTAAEAAQLATPQGRAAAAQRQRTEAAAQRAEDLADAARDRANDLHDPEQPPAKVEARYAREAKAVEDRYQKALARADRVAQGLPPLPPEARTPSGKPQPWFKPALRKATANPELYLSVLFTWAQRVALLLLPIVGLSLALVYRRRKDVFIYDHLLVAMNLMSFAFLAKPSA